MFKQLEIFLAPLILKVRKPNLLNGFGIFFIFNIGLGYESRDFLDRGVIKIRGHDWEVVMVDVQVWWKGTINTIKN